MSSFVLCSFVAAVFTRDNFDKIMPQEVSSSPRPGEKALAVMKVVSDAGIFKKPISPAKKAKPKEGRPKNVLDEEKYLHEMGKIIQRDFFPDLEKLKAQNDYLEALERNDIQKLRELYAKYSSGSRPPTEKYAASPATFETPIDARREEDEQGNVESLAREGTSATSQDGITIGDSLADGIPIGDDEEVAKPSLDEYLATFTSEDNQSFQEIMHEAELKHRQKFSWLYEAEEKSQRKQKDMLALPSIEEQAQGKERPFNIDTWGYTNKNYIMYVPAGVKLTADEEVEMAKRKQEIAHGNTRLARNPFNEQQVKEATHQLAQTQAHALEGKIGVDGKELTLATPKVNGYSYVKTPSPAPGVTDSPLMTWGVIEGTPFRLDGGDTPLRTTPGPSFRIAEPPKREKLALALAEKAGERHRDRKNKAIEAARRQLATPSPRPSSGLSLDRLSTMSPAARQLATSQLRRLGSDRALQASYSPRPSGITPGNTTGFTPKTPGGSSTPGSARSRAALAKAVRRKGASTPNPNLTDNLLNLPKRPRASDFFEPIV